MITERQADAQVVDGELEEERVERRAFRNDVRLRIGGLGRDGGAA